MKSAVLLKIIFLTGSLSSAYATEEYSENNDIPVYCDEQSQLAGIEDAAEKARYIKECVDSFGVASVEYQYPDQQADQ